MSFTHFRRIKTLRPLFRDIRFSISYFIVGSISLFRIRFQIRLKRKRIAGRPILSEETSNQEIYDILNTDTPCCITRVGAGEFISIVERRLIELGFMLDFPESTYYKCKNNYGVFPPNYNTLLEFAEEYEEACANSDMFAHWGHILYQDYFISRTLSKKVKLFNPLGLEPYYFENPWTKVLEGKKVLIVHPFAKLMEKQYENRKYLFVNKNTLPGFNLKTIVAINSSGESIPPFRDWFDVFEFMQSEIQKIDFDICLLGCGGYAVPLASKIKNMGKKAVVLGGALQLLFGIKGARWDNNPKINILYNDYWVRPDVTCTIPGQEKVEGGCYW